MLKWLIKLGRWLRARSPWRRDAFITYRETIGAAYYNPVAIATLEEAWLRQLNGAMEVLEEWPGSGTAGSGGPRSGAKVGLGPSTK